jgi:phospholipase/lecithinase/hemolysin
MKYVVSLMMFFWSICVGAHTLKEIVVFGDSLSDNGNIYEYMNHQLPMSPPYYEGRFADGPVWVELLMEKYYPGHGAAHLEDMAYGGAGIAMPGEVNQFSLQNQIKKYLEDHHDQLKPDSLYVIWMGANNYFNLPDDQDAVVKEVVRGIKSQTEFLIAHGGEHFVFMNVPDLSTTPAAIEFEATDELRHMSLLHNRLIEEMLAALRQAYPKVQIVDYDVTTLMNDIISSPLAYGFRDAKTTCFEHLDEGYAPRFKHNLMLNKLDSLAIPNDGVNCDTYLFFDLYHPTSHAHRIMADEMFQLFTKENIHFVE